MTISKLTPYSDSYKESCFQSWYAAGRPTMMKTVLDLLPKDEYGRIPNFEVFRKWRNEGKWDIRADSLDARVNKEMENKLVLQKVNMLEQQAIKARNMQEQAADYLDENGFDSSSSAVNAIIKGAELERTAMGLSDAILKLAKLSNDELMVETQKMLQKFLDSGESGDIIDVAETSDFDDSESSDTIEDDE